MLTTSPTTLHEQDDHFGVFWVVELRVGQKKYCSMTESCICAQQQSSQQAVFLAVVLLNASESYMELCSSNQLNNIA